MAILWLGYTTVGFPCNNKAVLLLTYTMMGFPSKIKLFCSLHMVGFPSKIKLFCSLHMVGFPRKIEPFQCFNTIHMKSYKYYTLIVITRIKFVLNFTRPGGGSILRHSICCTNTLTTWPSFFIKMDLFELIFVIYKITSQKDR